MQAEQFRLYNLDELLLVRCGDFVTRGCREMRTRRLPVHRAAHDVANDVAQSLAIAQAEGIRFTQRLANGFERCD